MMSLSMKKDDTLTGDIKISHPPDLSKGIYLVYNQMIYPIVKDVINIGRDEENDLVIPEDNVSREHAAIRKEKDDYVLYDLDSSNGTYVKYNPVKKHILKSGTLFYVADVVIVFVNEDEQMLKDLDRETGELNL